MQNPENHNKKLQMCHLVLHSGYNQGLFALKVTLNYSGRLVSKQYLPTFIHESGVTLKFCKGYDSSLLQKVYFGHISRRKMPLILIISFLSKLYGVGL